MFLSDFLFIDVHCQPKYFFFFANQMLFFTNLPLYNYYICWSYSNFSSKTSCAWYTKEKAAFFHIYFFPLRTAELDIHSCNATLFIIIFDADILSLPHLSYGFDLCILMMTIMMHWYASCLFVWYQIKGKGSVLSKALKKFFRILFIYLKRRRIIFFWNELNIL